MIGQDGFDIGFGQKFKRLEQIDDITVRAMNMHNVGLPMLDDMLEAIIRERGKASMTNAGQFADEGIKFAFWFGTYAFVAGGIDGFIGSVANEAMVVVGFEYGFDIRDYFAGTARYGIDVKQQDFHQKDS